MFRQHQRSCITEDSRRQKVACDAQHLVLKPLVKWFTLMSITSKNNVVIEKWSALDKAETENLLSICSCRNFS